MNSIYDELYESPNYYGNPMPQVIDFFRSSKKSVRVLDVGCGQGRHSIPLAEMGHEVTALDNSTKAINQLEQSILAIDTKVDIICQDAYEYTSYSNFDVLLFNLFFHFNSFEKAKEIRLLRKVIDELGEKSQLIITGYKNDQDLDLLKSLIFESSYNLKTRTDFFSYPQESENFQKNFYFFFTCQKRQLR